MPGSPACAALLIEGAGTSFGGAADFALAARSDRVSEENRTIDPSKSCAVASWSAALALAAALVTLAGCDRAAWPWGNDSKNGPIVLAGTVDAREVDLSFQVGGRILKLNADEGVVVKAGETVAELDPRDLELASARARAQAESAEKALAVLKAGSRMQDVRAGEAVLRQAEADLKLAQASRERTARLVADKFASPQTLDTANDQMDVAQAKVDQARQNLSLLREGARKEDIERAAADLDSARAAADTAAQQLAYAHLVSTVDGVVRKLATIS